MNLKLRNIFSDDEYFKILSYFSKEEFFPHVDELFFDLKEDKEKFHKDESNSYFLNSFIESIKKIKSKDDLHNNKYVKEFRILNNGNYASLAMILFSYLSNFKFQVISNFLFMNFNKIK